MRPNLREQLQVNRIDGSGVLVDEVMDIPAVGRGRCGGAGRKLSMLSGRELSPASALNGRTTMVRCAGLCLSRYGVPKERKLFCFLRHVTYLMTLYPDGFYDELTDGLMTLTRLMLSFTYFSVNSSVRNTNGRS